ncbi:MAG: hypothetical protein MJ136_05840 [Clostridia bacterium]|nr:hypothetical protein [Clostridia bacterium]
MAKSGLVRRTYGGVTLAHPQGNPFSMRNESNTEEKRLLAQKACALIPEGGVIFLDSSSTVVNMP